jgi:hypothetical protein
MSDIPMAVLFFFDQPLDIDRLIAGLARALGHIPSYGGRLRVRTEETGSETFEIVCNDAGVPITVVESDLTLAEALSELSSEKSALVEMVEPGRTGEQPLLKVRINRLADGGTVLGCSVNHVTGDGHSFLLLMRTWSAYVEQTNPPLVDNIEDRDAYLDQVLPTTDNGVPGYRLLEPGEAERLAVEFPQLMRSGRMLQIYFSDAELRRMRDKFRASTGYRLSRGDAVQAQVLTTIAKFEDVPRTRLLDIPVNIRPPLGLPDSVVGNMAGSIRLPYSPHVAPDQLAVDIRTAIGEFAEVHLSLRANRAFLSVPGRVLLRDFVPIGVGVGSPEIHVTNWSSFGRHEITFQGHRPKYFSPALSLSFPWTVQVTLGIDGRGMLWTLVLPEPLVERLKAAEGIELLHRFREPGDDPVPELLRSGVI